MDSLKLPGSHVIGAILGSQGSTINRICKEVWASGQLGGRVIHVE